jgi:hypothetical protein
MAHDLTSLMLAARQIADMENDPLCDDQEIATWLNDGLKRLYLAYVLLNSDAYLTSAPVVVVGSATTAPLPATFLRERGVDYFVNGRWKPLDVFQWRDRGSRDAGRRTYRVDSLIRFAPDDLDMSGTYRIWFHPTPPVLVEGSTLDAQMDLYSDYISNYAAAQMLVKAKLSPKAQLDMASFVYDRLDTEVPRRESEPAQAPDAYAGNGPDDDWG